MRPRARVLVAALIVATAGVEMAGRQFPAPAGWKWVTDSTATLTGSLDPAAGHWLFGTMAPGWHITTRPGVTLFEPGYAARARFALESEIFLFPGDSASGFGVFAGGQDLEGAARYVAFLIRRDGSAAIEHREGGRSTTLQPWTRQTAIRPGATSGDPISNTLRVEVEAASASFLVNGQKVAEIPRDARLDGIVGLRIGADLNLHVTNLDLTQRLALPRPKGDH